MKQFRIRFAKAIEAARKARGLSQEMLGSENGIATETVSNIERARVTPTLPNFVALVNALDLDAQALLGTVGQNEDKTISRLKLEADVDQVAKSLDDVELKTWIRLGHALLEQK